MPGLRVVDASVFPSIPSLFIASAAHLVGEKAAEVLPAEHPAGPCQPALIRARPASAPGLAQTRAPARSSARHPVPRVPLCGASCSPGVRKRSTWWPEPPGEGVILATPDRASAQMSANGGPVLVKGWHWVPMLDHF
nr:hypothetical protein [Streptomyces sp. M10]